MPEPIPTGGGRDWKSLVRAQVGDLRLDPSRAADVVDELAQHVAQAHAELVASGVADDEAVARALEPLRRHDRLAAEIARADRLRPRAPEPPPAAGAGWTSGWWPDLKYAARMLVRAPAVAALVVLTLGLGIGANTTIVSVVSAVLWRPLPFADADRLVHAGELAGDGSADNVGYLTFVDWRERSHGFESLVLIRDWTPTLTTDGRPEQIQGMRVSWNYFRMLGVRPAQGRDFRIEDDTVANRRVVLISDRLWRDRFHGDPNIVGRPLSMGGLSFQVVGVLPPDYQPLIEARFYARGDMWAPLGYDATLPQACRSCQHLRALGKLAPGIAREQVRADLDTLQAQLRREHVGDYAPHTITLVPMRDELTGKVRPALQMLLGAVLLVLLIGCANVANLLLARLARRDRELALRAALGASRGRLVRQMLIESALLALAGGAVGIALSLWAVPSLVRLTPTSISRLDTSSVADPRVLAFALITSLTTAFLFGLLPALRSSRAGAGSLHGDHRRTARAPASIARKLLIAFDVAVAMVLLAGAGLMIKSVGRLLAVDPGFNPDRVLSLQVSFVGPAYAENAAVLARADEILSRVRALPGVERAAMAGQIPLGGNGDSYGFHIEGRIAANEAEDPSVERYAVTPDYFAVMGIPLKRGRLFTDRDRADSESVMVIGEETARQLWPGQDPIGHRIRIGEATKGAWRTIVGIVGDVRHDALSAPLIKQMYLPQSQNTDGSMILVARTTGDPEALAPAAREAIWSVSRDLAVSNIATMASLVEKSAGSRRFVMWLLELFAGMALLLTAIGVYGVIAYSVAERTREIGLRSALGASPAGIVRLVLGGGLVVVAAGLVIGVVLAAGVTRYLAGSLFGVSATDPATFAAAALALLGVAALAHAVPVARALRVDPTVALRQE